MIKYSEETKKLFFVLPAFSIYILCVFIPMIFSFILSFFYYDQISTPIFTGFDNFLWVLKDTRFWITVVNTFQISFFAISGNIIVGFSLALLLNRNIPRPLLYILRLSYFSPMLIATSFVAMIWTYFYNTDVGIFNYYLNQIGIQKIPWLTDITFSMIAIILMDIWKNAGFFMIIFLAALQTVPTEYYEAAKIDGANAFQRIINVTVPIISPQIFFCFIVSSIGAIQIFESILILTNGGPGDATRSIVMYLYEEGFESLDYGYASALSFILFTIILIITAAQFKMQKRWVHY